MPAEMRTIIALWRLLDDIDTLDDACKSDDAVFRKRAYEIQRKRFDILSGEEFDLLASAPAPASGRVDAGRITLFSALEAAYIRGAAWCAEMGMTHTFSELLKAAYDYADKEEKDVICREVSASLSPAATPVSEAGG